jgi:hypothetical protein
MDKAWFYYLQVQNIKVMTNNHCVRVPLRACISPDTILCKYVLGDCGPGELSRYTDWLGLDGPGIDSQWGQDSPHPSSTDLGPTQLPIQWVIGKGKVPIQWVIGKGKVIPLQAWTGP